MTACSSSSSRRRSASAFRARTSKASGTARSPSPPTRPALLDSLRFVVTGWSHGPQSEVAHACAVGDGGVLRRDARAELRVAGLAAVVVPFVVLQADQPGPRSP